MSKNKFFIVVFIITIIGCTQRKDEIKSVICRDSIQYWDLVSFNQQGSRLIETYCFEKGGVFRSYYIDKDGNRRILTNGDNKVAIGKWSISNDSIFSIDYGHIKIAKYNEDTIFLGKSKNKDLLIRVTGKIDLINLGDPGDTLPKFKVLAPI
jgi:hypothetical protein